jgi:hypothetical protein
VVAGAVWIVTAFAGLSAPDRSAGFYAAELSWLVVHALVLVGIVHLLRSGLAGSLPWGRRGLQLAAAARVLFFAFEIAAIVRGTDELAVFPIAVIGTGVGMLVGGLAIVRAHVLRGWRRFAPLAVGAYPFVAIVPVFAATGTRPPNALVAGWGVTLVAVGVAVARRPALPAPMVTVTTV